MTERPCLSNKELNGYIMSHEKDEAQKQHLLHCGSCQKRHDLMRKLLEKMAEYPCFKHEIPRD